jgi:hypothetical protein
MDSVTIKRTVLLKKIKANREAHRAVVKKALAGYRARAIIEFEHQLKLAKQGKAFRRSLNLVKPEDHTKNYDRVIQMLELSASRVITLRERDFIRYVSDEWEWTDDFALSTSAYLGGREDN